MVTDCIIKEYKLYGREAEQIGKDLKAFLNDGYKAQLHYSAGSVGCVLLEAIKEKEEEKPKATKSKTTKKETAAE